MRKSRSRVFWDSVMSGRKQARHRTEIVAEMGGLVPRLDLAVICFFPLHFICTVSVFRVRGA